MVRKEKQESNVDQLDATKTQDQSRFLREVGASLSDVFGADDVLWVEGATEEACFPIMVSKLLDTSLLGTKIVGVLSTDDLLGKRPHDMFRIYRRLSEGGGLLPPHIGFIFDREERSDKDREDLKRESRESVWFLRRKMYENYLLNPYAIAWATSRIRGFSDGITPEEVEEWLDWNCAQYLETSVREEDMRSKETWLKDTHGAKVLENLFDHFLEHYVVYDKIRHGEMLTEWIAHNAQADLAETSDLLREALARRKTF